MSNLDTRPTETPCRSTPARGAVAELYPARTVPLGGIRGVAVERVLPQRTLPTVGAWCFLDQFGPVAGDMHVLPHPHIGLQTVTWPLVGRIRHRDSIGSDVEIRPGQLDLMTSGRGIAHSEFSQGDRPMLHGLQLWVALPEHAARTEPAFEQHRDLPRYTDRGIEATVFLGRLGGTASPATTFTPLVGADLTVTGSTCVPLRPDFEHALLVLDGTVEVDGVTTGRGPLLYLGIGRDELGILGDARAILLGGEPTSSDLVMWWNFVGRDHDEIAAAREDWETQGRQRFGTVAGHGGLRIPAPELPRVRLTPRRRRDP